MQRPRNCEPSTRTDAASSVFTIEISIDPSALLAPSDMAYRLGIDIGGTFTDVILIDEETGSIRIGKVPSTPRDPSDGFMDATHRMLSEGELASEAIDYIVHGTTVATNTIIEGNLARTGFMATAGFRDILEIARQIRPSLYDVQFEKPSPLVPRQLCKDVTERLDARGEVLEPLNEATVRSAAAELREADVESVAVCFLHSYVNPAHEIRVREILREEMSDVLISVSSDVASEFREYFRASTTVINACIQPVVAGYLDRISNRLRREGVNAELLVMQSNGGVRTFASGG